jgi:hypothetical protein
MPERVAVAFGGGQRRVEAHPDHVDELVVLPDRHASQANIGQKAADMGIDVVLDDHFPGRTPPAPDLLIRSTAISMPTSAVLPPEAPVPVSGCYVPILYGLASPKAARHDAEASIGAPNPMALPAALNRSSRRRVSLALQETSLPQSWLPIRASIR